VAEPPVSPIVQPVADPVVIANVAPTIAAPIAAPVPDTPQDAEQTLAAAIPLPAVTPLVPASVSENPTLTTAAAAPEPAPTVLDTVAALQLPASDAPAVAPVLLADDQGVRVLQPAIAPGATPEILATVALDTIAYDPAGDVQLSGRAAGGGVVRVYVDNRPVIEVPVDANGGWQSGLPGVPTGVYTMRVDQVNAAGQVVSRIETPFLREESSTVAAVMEDQTTSPDFTVAVKTVQPGATLWAIARERYGDGVMYVQVFEANRDRIRNPDLIYPGQVFVLPDVVGQ
jgi:nucleoid-associated protein YgaU